MSVTIVTSGSALPSARCWRRSAAFPSAALLGCLARAGVRVAGRAAAATSSVSPFASEEAVVGFFFPRPPDFLGGASSSGRSASLPPPAPLPGSQAVLLPPRQRVPPLRVRPSSCCETSVMPRVRSPLSTARGPRAATGIPGLALRGFKTSVDMTWRQATSRAHRLPFGPSMPFQRRHAVALCAGLRPDRPVADTALRVLAPLGLIFDENSPWLSVSACMGSPGCERSSADVRGDAIRAVESGTTAGRRHYVGCERACGRPVDGEVLVATPDGYRPLKPS